MIWVTFVATIRNLSTSKTFDITGTASSVPVPNDQWQLSEDDATWESSLSGITDTTVYVRYKPTLGGSEDPNGNITVDATDVAVSIPGKKIHLFPLIGWTGVYMTLPFFMMIYHLVPTSGMSFLEIYHLLV